MKPRSVAADPAFASAVRASPIRASSPAKSETSVPASGWLPTGVSRALAGRIACPVERASRRDVPQLRTGGGGEQGVISHLRHRRHLRQPARAVEEASSVAAASNKRVNQAGGPVGKGEVG